jgi:acyl-CoA thioesterase FadM
MLRRVILVRTDVSEESIASIITFTRIGELGTTLAVTSNPNMLHYDTKTKKQTPWPLVRKRTIPTERPPLVDEI